MLAKEIKNLTDDGYGTLKGPSAYGTFFIYDGEEESSHIRTCREEIADYFTEDNRWFGFCKSNLDVKNLNNFWRQMEERLGILPGKIERTWFYRTDLNDNCIVIKISPFWLESNLRRGMFTLLLRLAGVYWKDEGDFDKDLHTAIKKYDLANCIINTIKRFLDGHTECKYEDEIESGGKIVSFFKYIDNDKKELENYLP